MRNIGKTDTDIFKKMNIVKILASRVIIYTHNNRLNKSSTVLKRDFDLIGRYSRIDGHIVGHIVLYGWLYYHIQDLPCMLTPHFSLNNNIYENYDFYNI